MKKIKVYILFGMLIFPFYLMAQVDSFPLKIKQIRKYGINNPILLDSMDFVYDDKNQLIQTKNHQFYGTNSNDLKVTDYEYNTLGKAVSICTNEFRMERLKSGTKQIQIFDDQQNLISTTYQQNRGGQFFNTIRILNTYDDTHNLITQTEQEWIYVFPNRIWQNLSLDSMAYNANGQITYQSKSHWEVDKWTINQATQTNYNENGTLIYFGPVDCHTQNCRLSEEEIYTYNEVNQLISQSIRSSILSRGGWFIDSTLTEFNYDSNGQLVHQKDSTLISKIEWDSFFLSRTNKIYYDSLGKITKEFITRFENGQVEKIEEKILDTTSNNNYLRYQTFITNRRDSINQYLERIEATRFDEQGNRIASYNLNLTENGDTSNLSLDTLIYDVSNRLIYQRKDDLFEGKLMPRSQSSYQFNEIGLSLMERHQFWLNESWIDVRYTLNEYDDQFHLQFTEQYTKMAPLHLNNSQFDDFYTLTYYQQPLSVDIKEVPDFEVDIFPNPVVDYLQINLPDSQILPAKASLYTINGQLVFETTLSTSKSQIILPTLSSGPYFLYLKTHQFQLTKKIVLIR